MIFRAAEILDIDGIMQIIGQAQEYMKSCEIDQWQNNYPNEESIKLDIDNKYGYILEDEGEIVSTGALSFDGEETYDTIYEGQWKTKSDALYGVIHRVAVANNRKGQGTAGILFGKLEEICVEKKRKSIRIDTHKDNKSMQAFLLKNGFIYCGIIYLKDGNERLAFEKIL